MPSPIDRCAAHESRATSGSLADQGRGSVEGSAYRAEGGRCRAAKHNLFGLLLLFAVATLLVPGCSCRQETPQERAARLANEEQRRLDQLEEQKRRQEEKKKKPPIETKLPLPQPNQAERPSPIIKPGHWMSVAQTTKANYEDWVGRSQQQIVASRNQSMPIERTMFTLRTSRDAALVKGQEKQLESILFSPNNDNPQSLRTSLLDRGGGYAVPPVSLSMSRMMPHQYHFVVLAAEPERYGYLRNGNYAVDAPLNWKYDINSFSQAMPARRNYRVVTPDIQKRLPLSDNPLCWTTTAYVLWDEVDPEKFDAGQRQALIDWLHWGGQLIISGPDSLGLLAESFLSPYLPADGAGARQLTSADLRALATSYQASRRRTPDLAESGPWSGVKLKHRTESQPIPNVADLFAERRVGRGRIIVSSMQLAERGLINWAGGYENLFNALVLRRPPRQFVLSNANFDGLDSGIYINAAGTNSPQLDAEANTKLRFFSRDTYNESTPHRYRATQNTTDEYALKPGSHAGGAASWNDFNAAADAARESLREAAGVKIPRRSFVLSCLGAYLAIIGPLNWFFFKALGRVELAWVAAPIITVISAVSVVRLAELDIGFARARTEIAILETQPGHARGHMSRYTAIYTSLATTYELTSDEPTTLIAPFPSISRNETLRILPGQTFTDVNFERQEKVRLKGFAVTSAAAAMTHSEHLYAMPAGLSYDPQRQQMVNRTGLDLNSLAIVQRTKASDQQEVPTLLGCWIGALPSDEAATLSFLPIPFSADQPVFAAERAKESQQATEEQLNLEPLIRLALDPQRLEPGEIRAVARIDKVLPGAQLKPKAAQVRGATLLVAHLQYGPLPAPVSDVNAPIDVAPRN